MRSRLARWLIRLYGYREEFLCCTNGALEGLLQWSLDDGPVDPKDLTLLGYEPFVIHLPKDRKSTMLTVHLEGSELANARLEQLPFADPKGFPGLHKGSEPHINLLPRHLHALDRLRQRLNRRIAGNVATDLQRYDLTRLGYMQPREIHLASVGTPDKGNVFPTDLHGPMDVDEYLISLRKDGKANAQVEAVGALTLSRMPLSACRKVYALGGRHMAPMETISAILPTHHLWEGYAIPAEALSTVLLERVSSVDVGLHRIHRLAVRNSAGWKEGQALAHIHASIAYRLRTSGRTVSVLERRERDDLNG
ncbi:MAG: hypothetical protein KDB88_03080 [Flavobacteriales bacterium]|nr:hypothetical protein [Flavobacteriales bacterium]